MKQYTLLSSIIVLGLISSFYLILYLNYTSSSSSQRSYRSGSHKHPATPGHAPIHPRELETGRRRLMFFKTHKCGTSSLALILYLYGISRRLNFVLTPYLHQFFTDRPAGPAGVPPAEYHILCQHQRNSAGLSWYNPEAVRRVLPREESVYVTILREPTAQFLSNFIFYGHDKKVRASLTKETGADTTLDTILETYFSQLHLDRLTVSPVVNPMSFDLGFTEFLRSSKSEEEAISSFISWLDEEFDLVMITDEFDKSLLLLRYLMGWDVGDVVYLKRMTRSVSAQNSQAPELSEMVGELLHKHNRVDYAVYGYFRKKLENLLKRLEPDPVIFDLVELGQQRGELEKLCLDKSTVKRNKLGIESYPISKTGFEHARCRLWGISDIYIAKVLAAEQDPKFSKKYHKTLDQGQVKLSYSGFVGIMGLFEKYRVESETIRNCDKC